MQYFLGLDDFTHRPVFDPSLFVTIRYRIGDDMFDRMHQQIMSKALKIKGRPKEESQGDDKGPGNQEQMPCDVGDKGQLSQKQESLPVNKGKLQMDATVADAYIKYPIDIGLLNDGREMSEKLIDALCDKAGCQKPRTYRRVARKDDLNIEKKKNKNKIEIRKGLRKQLNYLQRNIASSNKILDTQPGVMAL